MVDMAGLMHGTLAADRVEAVGFGAAAKLHRQRQLGQGLCHALADHRRRCLPGGPAGRPPHDGEGGDPPLIVTACLQQGQAETLPIETQVGMGRLTATGEGAEGPGMLLARCQDRDTPAPAQFDQILGQVGVPEIIEYQIGRDVVGQILRWIFNKIGQRHVEGNHLGNFDLPTVSLDSGDLMPGRSPLFIHHETHRLLRMIA